MISTRAPSSVSLKQFTVLGNVAMGSSATQSSTHTSWSAKKAVDGIKNSWTSCSSTGYVTNPYWRLDLLKIYRVHRVVVTNRIDCCPEQTTGAEIRIGNSLKNDGNDNPVCTVISSIPIGASSTFSCGGMVGRYVNLIIPGEWKSLTLCEVEVYGRGTTTD
ncbi:fucolectin-4-like [Megalobrama amblycephala]|uniref:fucolectin-4-like n=1 Tax=Megalobrama amblycephala TaxID=75352 RepID=UPI0020142118|nr:fucolectin-4-like [Megalobrama amblycephala]